MALRKAAAVALILAEAIILAGVETGALLLAEPVILARVETGVGQGRTPHRGSPSLYMLVRWHGVQSFALVGFYLPRDLFLSS